MTLGERMRKMRKRLGLTQKEFAGRVPGKIDYTYIGKIERGQQYPSLKMLERIGKAFSTPLSYFFEDNSFLKSLDLLPGEVKDLLKDKKRQDCLRMSRDLKPQDLDLVMQIMNLLIQKKPVEDLQLAEAELDCPSYGGEKEKRLRKKENFNKTKEAEEQSSAS